MNAFDKVIGYKATKRELLQLCDMLRNREIYEEMGARLPHGLLLYGDPGLGKTLLARCFVEESGLHTITVRRDKGGDAFIDGITQAFASAKTKAPSIVLLDDMDKFANEDDTHCDAPEYAAVQAGIPDGLTEKSDFKRPRRPTRRRSSPTILNRKRFRTVSTWKT